MMNDGSRNCDLARGRGAADGLDYRRMARDSTPMNSPIGNRARVHGEAEWRRDNQASISTTATTTKWKGGSALLSSSISRKLHATTVRPEPKS